MTLPFKIKQNKKRENEQKLSRKEGKTEASPEKIVKVRGMGGGHVVWKPFYVKCDSLGLVSWSVPATVVTYPQGAQSSCPGSQRRHQELFWEVRDVVPYRMSLPQR